MRSWIQRHVVVSYYLIALTLTWAYWLALLACGLRVEPGSTATHLPGLLGPAFAAFIVTAINTGGPGLRELLGRVGKLQAPRVRNILLAISPLALGFVAFVALHLLGSPLPTLAGFSHYPGLPPHWPLPLIVIASLVVNGFGEEIGWRGFATEQLQAKYGWFKATLLVTILWALWHVPVFWLNMNMNSLVGPQLFGWAFGLLCGAFVLAQVYLLSGHSILCAAIWHTSFNMLVATDAGHGQPAAVISTLVMIWGIVVAVRWWRAPPVKSS